MEQHFQYGVACAMEEVPASWAINLRGSIDDLTQTASQLGYDALELQLCNPQNYDWKQLRRTAEQHGLRFCADATGRELIENGLSLISADPGVRRAAIDRLKLHALLEKKEQDLIELQEEVEELRRLVKQADHTAIHATADMYNVTPEQLAEIMKSIFGEKPLPELPKDLTVASGEPDIPHGEEDES